MRNRARKRRAPIAEILNRDRTGHCHDQHRSDGWGGRASGAGHHGAGHHGAYGLAEYGFVLGSAGIWGASFILIAESLEHFAPGVVTFVRISVGALTLMAFKAARQPVDRSDWRAIVVLSIVWLAFPMTLYPIAQQHISSGLAGMLGASIPIFTAVLATVLHGLVPAAIHRFGILVGAIGIVVLGLPALGEGSSSVLGVVLIIAACVSYGVAFNVAVPLVHKYGSMPVFWRALLVSVPLTLPLALVRTPHELVRALLARRQRHPRRRWHGHRVRAPARAHRPRRRHPQLDGHLPGSRGGVRTRHPRTPRGGPTARGAGLRDAARRRLAGVPRLRPTATDRLTG